MFTPLRDRTYRFLFLAQLLSLLGTGLATVALGLLAYDLAGADAGVVLGTALFIKMVAYVFVAPVVGGFVGTLPRRAVLVSLDLARALIILALPWVDQIWQIYVLILVLQVASAAFTPTFQATIPSVLPDEAQYTKALSLSRLAYDLENILSPLAAAALLSVITFHWLFGGTALGFIASAALVGAAGLALAPEERRDEGFFIRATRGIRIYFSKRYLRGFLGFNLAISGTSAFVLVNTVVFVKASLGGDDSDVAIALGAFGGGSMAAAFVLPRLLKHRSERAVISGGGILTALVFSGLGLILLTQPASWPLLLGGWFATGVGFSAVLTPIGRLLRRAAPEDDLPAIFAAQFALTHVCWLITYPLAGFLGDYIGLPGTVLVMGIVAWLGVVIGFSCWPADEIGDAG